MPRYTLNQSLPPASFYCPIRNVEEELVPLTVADCIHTMTGGVHT